jgi:hypothetical protein
LSFFTPTPGSLGGYTGGPLNGVVFRVGSQPTLPVWFTTSGALIPIPEPATAAPLAALLAVCALLRKKATRCNHIGTRAGRC